MAVDNVKMRATVGSIPVPTGPGLTLLVAGDLLDQIDDAPA